MRSNRALRPADPDPQRTSRASGAGYGAHLLGSIAVGLLLLGGAAAVVLPAVWAADVERTRARLGDVADAARTLREEWIGCPSAEDLVRAEMYPEPPTDPWGGRVEIRCEGERVVAVSAGPDGRPGTKDDIRR